MVVAATDQGLWDSRSRNAKLYFTRNLVKKQVKFQDF